MLKQIYSKEKIKAIKRKTIIHKKSIKIFNSFTELGKIKHIFDR